MSDAELVQVALDDRPAVFVVDELGDAREQAVPSFLGQGPVTGVGAEQLKVAAGGVADVLLIAPVNGWPEQLRVIDLVDGSSDRVRWRQPQVRRRSRVLSLVAVLH
ncbi:MAG: hypothetical protein ACRDTD_23260 [Pseudonocardiaceae bacterium]